MAQGLADGLAHGLAHGVSRRLQCAYIKKAKTQDNKNAHILYNRTPGVHLNTMRTPIK